jgi:hypothetical protein
MQQTGLEHYPVLPRVSFKRHICYINKYQDTYLLMRKKIKSDI